MQAWLIVLIVIACVVVLVAAVMLCSALMSVHIVLGRRRSSAEVVPSSGVDLKYGVDYKWFDNVKPDTQSFSITSFDGVKLAALLVKNGEQNNRVAICCHGYGVTYKSVQFQAQLFYDRGFDVLLPSMRGHGASEGKVGMAWIDRFDLLRWIDMIIERYGKNAEIALAGVSMGGATVIGAARMNPPSQVKCVVDDCGFSSHSAQYAARLEKMGKLKSLLFFGFDAGLKLVHGYSYKTADFVPLAANMTVPALFIHGDADGVVPRESGDALFSACGSKFKKQLIVESAGHATAFATDCRAYAAAVDELIDKSFDGVPERPNTPLPIEAERARLEDERVQKEEQARLEAERADNPEIDNEQAEPEEQQVETTIGGKAETDAPAEDTAQGDTDEIEATGEAQADAEAETKNDSLDD